MKITAALLAALACCAGCACAQFVNEDVKTKLDLSKHVVKLAHTVTAAGTSAKASKYQVAIPTTLAEHLALVEAKNLVTDSMLQVAELDSE